ncbi:hypothetical protein HII31_06764 [Pseudocercospora fuligena]|uniref:Uncharacterized protein n=1 Tax=Pseudocercospora fuligena TaxID=685502 RepID=A0A8H6RIP8_9PEZI|nr:hypothetical protein HII31_06764 [Pseudocercospora fuligena]
MPIIPTSAGVQALSPVTAMPALTPTTMLSCAHSLRTYSESITEPCMEPVRVTKMVPATEPTATATTSSGSDAAAPTTLMTTIKSVDGGFTQTTVPVWPDFMSTELPESMMTQMTVVDVPITKTTEQASTTPIRLDSSMIAEPSDIPEPDMEKSQAEPLTWNDLIHSRLITPRGVIELDVWGPRLPELKDFRLITPDQVFSLAEFPNGKKPLTWDEFKNSTLVLPNGSIDIAKWNDKPLTWEDIRDTIITNPGGVFSFGNGLIEPPQTSTCFLGNIARLFGHSCDKTTR